jgi:hypothetical protein
VEVALEGKGCQYYRRQGTSKNNACEGGIIIEMASHKMEEGRRPRQEERRRRREDLQVNIAWISLHLYVCLMPMPFKRKEKTHRQSTL